MFPLSLLTAILAESLWNRMSKLEAVGGDSWCWMQAPPSWYAL